MESIYVHCARIDLFAIFRGYFIKILLRSGNSQVRKEGYLIETSASCVISVELGDIVRPAAKKSPRRCPECSRSTTFSEFARGVGHEASNDTKLEGRMDLSGWVKVVRNTTGAPHLLEINGPSHLDDPNKSNTL
jgi:hypothetical protein